MPLGRGPTGSLCLAMERQRIRNAEQLRGTKISSGSFVKREVLVKVERYVSGFPS